MSIRDVNNDIRITRELFEQMFGLIKKTREIDHNAVTCAELRAQFREIREEAHDAIVAIKREIHDYSQANSGDERSRS